MTLRAACLIPICLAVAAAPSRARTPAAAPPAGWSSSWTEPQSDSDRRVAELKRQVILAAKSHDYRPALATCAQIIKDQPEAAQCYLWRGAVYFAARDIGRARTDFEHALRLAGGEHNPLLVSVLESNRAGCDLLERRWSDAASALHAALKAFPANTDAMNSLAWLEATCPAAEVRRGGEAVDLARRACRGAGAPRASYLDTLAAAYAENNDFSRAIATENEALRSCPAVYLDKPAGYYRKLFAERIALYRQGKAYREDPAAAAF